MSVTSGGTGLSAKQAAALYQQAANSLQNAGSYAPAAAKPQNLTFIKGAIRVLVESDMNCSSWCVLGLSVALSLGAMIQTTLLAMSITSRVFMTLWPLEIGCLAFWFMRRSKNAIIKMLEDE